MSTQTDTIATRHNNTSTITTPLAKEYWTPERLTWLEEAVIENQYLYVAHIEEGNHLHTYRPSSGELIRRLKGLPEWAGLSPRQAHDALVIGLGKIRDAGGDPWDLLPDNDVKGLSAEEDFIEAWPEVRGSRIDLAEVVAQVKANPTAWNPELEEMLKPVTPNYRLFCDICVRLQSMVGSDNYILLPQHQLASLLGTKQGGISSYCNRATKAGFLVELNDGQWSHAQHQAKKYRCTSTLTSQICGRCPDDDIPY